MPKQGEWLFTCSMKPLQFNKWTPRDPKDYFEDNRWENYSPEEKHAWLHDDFETIGGSEHSRTNCSLKPISETYALWFIKNECWNIYNQIEIELKAHHEFTDEEWSEKLWSTYEERIKALCERDGMIFEGF